MEPNEDYNKSPPNDEYLKVVPRIAYYLKNEEYFEVYSNINLDYSQQQGRKGEYIYFQKLPRAHEHPQRA